MGMDLYPVHPRTRKAKKGLSVNLGAWGDVKQLLEQLGCDTGEMSFINDGERVRAATCRQWAEALQSQMSKIRNITIKQRTAPKVIFAMCLEGREKEFISAISARPNKRMTRRNCEVMALTKEDVKWLKELAEFFHDCGGFRQY